MTKLEFSVKKPSCKIQFPRLSSFNSSKIVINILSTQNQLFLHKTHHFNPISYSKSESYAIRHSAKEKTSSTFFIFYYYPFDILNAKMNPSINSLCHRFASLTTKCF